MSDSETSVSENDEAIEIERDAPASQPDTDSDAAALQNENARLRAQLADHDAREAARGHPWRQAGVALLIVLACVLLALANVGFWLKYTALNTNGWTAAVGPLSQNEVIVEAASEYVVDELFAELDVEQLTHELVPEEYKQYSQPLSSVLRMLAEEAAGTVIDSDEFHEVWLAVNRTAHRTVVDVLRGEGSLVYLGEGNVTVDLGDLFDSIQDTIGIPDMGLLSEEDTQFVLFSSEDLASIQRLVATIDFVGLLLPVLTIITFGVALWVSLTRRRTLQWIGIGVAATMLLQLPLFGAIKPVVLGYVEEPFVRALAVEVWDTVTRTLTNQTVFVMIVGLLIAFGAWFAGPNEWAVDTRTEIRTWWEDRRRTA